MFKTTFRICVFIMVGFIGVSMQKVDSVAPKAIIFDCDGTLVDSEKFHYLQAW